MFAGMNQEQIFSKLQADNERMHAEMIQMKQMVDQANAAAAGATAAAAAAAAAGATGGGGKGGDWHQGQGAWEQGGKGGNGRVVLDEKYFRRREKFDGTFAKFKSWVFDLITAVGSVDQSLAGDMKGLMKLRSKI